MGPASDDVGPIAHCETSESPRSEDYVTWNMARIPDRAGAEHWWPPWSTSPAPSHRKPPFIFDEAVRPAVAAYERLDWEVLEDRAPHAAMSGSLAGVAPPDAPRGETAGRPHGCWATDERRRAQWPGPPGRLADPGSTGRVPCLGRRRPWNRLLRRHHRRATRPQVWMLRRSNRS
jgi:hypothetical protein